MLPAEAKKRILIVDRDIAAVAPLHQRLGDAGLSVSLITDGSAAIRAINELPPHLVIIDWDMPDLVAAEVIECVRRARTPRLIRLIILSALTGEDHVVMGLNLGADDYITKPYSTREAIARVTSVLRSIPHRPSCSATLIDELELDSATNRVTAKGIPLSVRGMEYRLLEFLMLHAGKIFSRSQLLSQVWGGDTEVDERTVDVNVQRLRKILSGCGYEAYIQTIRGYGYRFGPPVPTAHSSLSPIPDSVSSPLSSK